MTKINKIRIRGQSAQSYHPISTFAEEVLWSQDSALTLIDILGEDINYSENGSLQDQIDQLLETKISIADFNEQKEELENQINAKVSSNQALKNDDLISEKEVDNQSETISNTENRQYAVTKDKNGKLSVNVPWTDTVNEINNTLHFKLGQGYGICNTEASNSQKVVQLNNYSQIIGGIVAIRFNNSIIGNATLNINNTGQKPIIYKNQPLVRQIVLGGDTVTFIYDGSVYRIISIDRDKDTNTTYSSMTDSQADDATSNIPHTISPMILNNKINRNINAKRITITQVSGEDGVIEFGIN